MPGGGGGSLNSTLFDNAFRNIFYNYLPAGEAPGGVPKTVARVFFKTGEPLKTLKNKKVPPTAFYTDPEDFLTLTDKIILQDLFKPIDGGHNGNFTNDPNKSIPIPSNPKQTSGHTYREVFNKLTTMTWRFEGYADPRESSQFNKDLSQYRGGVVASFMIKALWAGLPNPPATNKNMMKNLLYAYKGKYSQKRWNQTHLKQIPADQKWRVYTIKAIMNGLFGNSKWAGDQGHDPSDVPQQKWPALRRIDIKVNSVIGSAEHDWTTDCSVMSKKRRYYDAADWQELPSVINPDFLYDFNPATQSSGDDNVPAQLRLETKGRKRRFARGQIDDRTFASELTKSLYGYRYVRMIQHELLRGNVPPTAGKGPEPGYSNPGTDIKARSMLCGTTGLGRLEAIFDYMIPNDLGGFIFGGNIIDNTAGIKQARQIAHLFYVRIDPWYRAAFMKEIPASKPSEAWLDSDSVATPPDEVELWPSAEDLSDLPHNIKKELDPRNHGNTGAITPPKDPHWETDIPKDLKDNAVYGRPAGYKSGKEHYRWLAENGGFKYRDLSYLSDQNSVVKKSERRRLSREYRKKNNYDPDGKSYLRNHRDAMREGMKIMKDELTDDQWDVYVSRGRKGYPDYTDRSDWQTWGNPGKSSDPYRG